ncbi:MAG: BTAD domain-containing putative transcriptional regulator [Gemmatimonas sp.]
MSLQLKLLGGLSLVDSASTLARVTRRHRLAVLAVLATSDRPVARERLLALLWPDSPDEAARHALGQVLYGLRQDVALSELVSGATDLSIDRSKIGCDLWEFRDALKAGDHRAALAVYSGPFLDGVQLPNADSFDRWCEEERRALTQQSRDAMETLASIANASGDFPESAGWWRRLSVSDPLSSRIALACMRALVASGDRAAAIQHARVHSALVRAELEVDADPAVTAYEMELRHTPAPNPIHPSSAVVPPSATTVGHPNSPSPVQNPYSATPVESNAALVPDRTTPTTPTAHANQALPINGATPASRSPRRLGIALTTVATAIALTWAAIARQQKSPVHEPTTAANTIPVVAVLPFDIQGDTTRTFIGEALATLLADRLDAPGVLRTVESNAVLSAVGRTRSARETDSPGAQEKRIAALGAGLVVHGAVVVLSDSLEISAELRDVNGADRIVRETVSGSVDSLFALADRLGAKLLVAREGRPLGNSALGGTNSVPALKSLLAGERALRAWKLPAAMVAYQSALAIDSTYALAWYRLAFAEAWAGIGDHGERSSMHAMQYVANLPDRYAMLLKAMKARSLVDPGAESMLLTLVQRYPDDADAWEELGEFRMHVGPLFGQPTSNARAPFDRALALDSIGHPEVRVHLAQLAFERGDVAAGRALVSGMMFGDDNDRSVRGGRLILALIGNAPESVPQLVQSLRDSPASGTMFRTSASTVGILPSAHALAESLSVSSASRDLQYDGLVTLMQMDAGLRRWDRVQRSGATLAVLDSLGAAESWGWIAQTPLSQIPVSTLRWASAMLERAGVAESSQRGTQRMASAAIMSVLGNDTASYARTMKMLAKRRDTTANRDQTLHAIRAFRAHAVGDSAEFTREMRDVRGPVDWQFARWLKGEALEQEGKYEEAERWYLSTPWGPNALMLTRAAWEKAALMERKRGNEAAAKDWERRALSW